MKKITPLIILACLTTLSVFGESRISYEKWIKMGALRKQHNIEGESCIRIYLKPLKPEIKVADIKVHIVRGDTILKEIPIHIRENYNPSDENNYPWEMFLPVDKKYTEEGSELVNNLEPGSLKLGFGYGVTKDGKILND